MSNYPYAPPPPAPSSAPPTSYSYSPGQGYTNTPPRGGHAGAMNGGRAHGHPQGPGRGEYGSPYYQPQGYSSPGSGQYSAPQPNSYWQGASPTTHPHPSASPLPPSNYHPNYAPQGFHQPAQGYPSQYPNQPSRLPYGPAFGQPPNDYAHPPQQWGEQGQPYPQYSNRGGRGGYQSDRGGHKSDHAMGPPIRVGFDQRNEPPAQASSGYSQPYPNNPHHQPTPYQQPSYSYPPTTAPSFSGPSHTQYGTNSRGHGRGGFAHSNRGAHTTNNDRGEKFRHRDQRPPQAFNNTQKSDPAFAKKKKRKTNTLGLTPGDDDSDDGIDEEKHLEELLGVDAPTVTDLAAWLAERKANYPTKARIAAKKAAGVVQTTDGGNADKPAAAASTTAPKVDPVQEEADRLRKKLAKVEKKLEKRKRAANDEGDEMRSESSDSSSEDEKPEALPTGKPSTGFLPPPPITRADPTNHCKYYSTGGICGKKGKCRFVHDPAVREAALQERTKNGGRMTLKQRLILNDKEQEDMEVIKTIVEMRANGRLDDPQNPHIRAARQAHEQSTVTAVSTLPTTPGAANLPPNPYTASKNLDESRRRHKPKKHNDPNVVKYAGWGKLVGYGGTGVPPKQLPS
ncbi:hypothetical protein F4779DRAFT_366542 [Xylariaceae sp. FL0662B]|nr:hypothetical protein F4779DRAFT_366542 [Xylariaceae sp. FL0662B]